MECRFVVWERMWLTDPEERKKLTEQKCSTDSHLTCSEGVVQMKNTILEEEIDVSKLFHQNYSSNKAKEINTLSCNYLLISDCFVQAPEIPKEEEETRHAFNEFVEKYEKPYQNDEAGL